MEWTDLLTKVGVGACLGFGIIVLAKLGKKKDKHDQKTTNSDAAFKKDSASSADTGSNEH